MFNFKDVARVMQGVQLLASKSKVVPAKISKKHQQKLKEVQVTQFTYAKGGRCRSRLCVVVDVLCVVGGQCCLKGWTELD